MRTREKGDVEHSGKPFTEAHQRDDSQVEWRVPKLNADGIISKLKSHEHFEIKSGYTMSGLPKFHDLTA